MSNFYCCALGRKILVSETVSLIRRDGQGEMTVCLLGSAHILKIGILGEILEQALLKV